MELSEDIQDELAVLNHEKGELSNYLYDGPNAPPNISIQSQLDIIERKMKFLELQLYQIKEKIYI